MQFQAAYAFCVADQGRQDQHWSVVLAVPHLLQDLEAVDSAQHDVEDHQVEAALGDSFHSSEPRADQFRVVTLHPEVVADRLTECGFVLDDQDPASHDTPPAIGRWIVNSEPRSGPALETST